MAGEKILVVEDERVVARDIEKRLKNLGYQVPASVASGEAALIKVAELQPDLVLMDIQLRGALDGIATAEQIRADFDIPVIYLTAFADEDTLQRAKASEPFGYIVKPFDEKDLHVTIEVAFRRRLAEAAIRVALEKEKELSELKSRFWSMIIHEFRNPLTSILSSAQLLELHGHRLSDDRKQEYLGLIQNSVRAINQLMNDTLTIVQTEKSDLEFNPASLDLEAFCRDLVEEIQFNVQSNHRIIFTLRGNCDDYCLDRKLLWHILTNLLSNAVKYSPLGGEIYLNLICTEQEVVFQVRDKGIGIPSETQTHLFEPFHRATNVGNIPGTGLGLTLVRKCLDLHSGHIEVESEVGQGSTFTVRFYSACAISQRH
ncbi:ATP-binding protein [Pseudanabaena sp. FACHB-2040]|uniref:hybrid sensor histidine kinase/response regulator n=1 Tax=Pseudanabaena sp. FACHB-2040 TaxID=2692859 RepID=UPI0016857243|nr:ATP-binding protein [Pseudanabaena sp. FACHB-2040]MBD2257881.1 response regulator [Pseudanabaena sp. FACHB-2040]